MEKGIVNVKLMHINYKLIKSGLKIVSNKWL